MPAPKGNKNSTLEKRAFNNALRREVAQNPEKLAEAARFLLWSAARGDLPSQKELADRLDGKAAQSVTIGGDDDNPLAFSVIERVIIDKARASFKD